MKKLAMLAAVAALGCAWPGVAAAQYYYGYDRPPLRGLLPPYEIATIVRSMGFDPIGRPFLRGRAYVVRAIDQGDMPLRVVVDAFSGRVLTVREDVAMWPGDQYGARYAYAPRYAPGLRYGEYAPIPPASIPTRRPAQRSAAVTTGTPLPRQRPADAFAPATTGSINVAPATPAPGHSIPAPVAGRTSPAATAGAASQPVAKPPAPAATTPAAPVTAAASKVMPLVPVAPLD